MPQRLASRMLFAVLGVLSFAACGGEGEVGDPCDSRGATTDECAEGSVCEKDEADELVCQKLCDDQEDCAANENCNGVSGSSLKSCRPKDSDDDSGKK